MNRIWVSFFFQLISVAEGRSALIAKNSFDPPPCLPLKGGGFEIADTPRLWIEAKTVSFAGLRDEVDIQTKTLRKKCSEAVVMTLLPEGTDPQGTDRITWSTVDKVIVESLNRIQRSNVSKDFLLGYQKMLTEFRRRLAAHEKPLLKA